MAGFSLGGTSNQPPSDDPIPPESLFLYHGAQHHRGDEQIATSYSKGFELWQHHQQQRHHQFYSVGPSGLGMFLDDPLAGSSSGAVLSAAARAPRGSSGGGMSCQDCGNQAKKDCMHMRCRTCCKSRNFHCPTHVKSTWVPAAKRRERQHQLTAAVQQHQHTRGGAEQSKRPRDLVVSHHPTATSSTSGGMEAAITFPLEVSTTAVFRCVRVTSVDAEEQYAYKTAVNIGGRVFRGLLYDRGPDFPGGGQHGEASSSSPVTVAAIAANAGSSAGSAAAVASSVMDPSFYPASLNAFMAGTQFFPHPRP